MSILTDICNKVVSFFAATKESENSKSEACNRLRLVLLHDRAGLSENTLQMMRTELIGVISKYMEINTEALDLKLESEGESIALMLGIPVIRAKTEEEILAAMKVKKEPQTKTVKKATKKGAKKTSTAVKKRKRIE